MSNTETRYAGGRRDVGEDRSSVRAANEVQPDVRTPRPAAKEPYTNFTDTELADMGELRARARELEIPGRSSMTRDELAAAIATAEEQ